jgi:hypothetical protein
LFRRILNSALTKTIFFGNHFYGLCAVALSVEASLQQRFPLADLLFYLLLYLAVVLYYNQAYLVTESVVDDTNIRSSWYSANSKLLKAVQYSLLIGFAACGSFLLVRHWQALTAMKAYEWVLVFIFPLVSALYYGIGYSGWRLVLRNVGWLKPFIIGFSWAGMVTVYPILYYCIANGSHYDFTLIGLFLFIKNFMFVAVLCIMFDIKDYAMDYNLQLKTFVVKLGLRKTIYIVIFPLCVAGLASFVAYAVFNHFHPVKIFLNVLPFIAILAVAYSLHSRRSIFYYLVIIDGLMLFKAFCGSMGMVFF